jgi:hypothetical protein
MCSSTGRAAGRKSFYEIVKVTGLREVELSAPSSKLSIKFDLPL